MSNHTAHFTTNDEDQNEIKVTVHYSITTSSYEPNTQSGRWPAEWEIDKIWYGDTRLNGLEDLEQYDDMLVREIESYLDNEVEDL